MGILEPGKSDLYHVLLSNRCDNAYDCTDRSDEDNCPTRPPGQCHEDEFQCQVGGCIPQAWKCDSHNDCEDGTDEAGCRKYPATMKTRLE